MYSKTRTPHKGYHTIWYGMVWHGTVWYGMVRYGMVAWYGMAWYGMVRYGMVWYGMVVIVGLLQPSCGVRPTPSQRGYLLCPKVFVIRTLSLSQRSSRQPVPLFQQHHDQHVRHGVLPTPCEVYTGNIPAHWRASSCFVRVPSHTRSIANLLKPRSPRAKRIVMMMDHAARDLQSNAAAASLLWA